LRDIFVTAAATSRAFGWTGCFRFADFPDPDFWTARRVWMHRNEPSILDSSTL